MPIEQAIATAISKAHFCKCAVQFDFNGTLVEVTENSILSEVAEDWNQRHQARTSTQKALPPLHDFRATHIPVETLSMQAAMQVYQRLLNKKIDDLTMEQTVDVIRQAIESGDFQRLIASDGRGQKVIYLPGSEAFRLRSENESLRERLKNTEGEINLLKATLQLGKHVLDAQEGRHREEIEKLTASSPQT
jgi:hypothetical protein